MVSLDFVLLLLALICFVLSAIPVPVPRINLTALGLAFFTLTLLIT